MFAEIIIQKPSFYRPWLFWPQEAAWCCVFLFICCHVQFLPHPNAAFVEEPGCWPESRHAEVGDELLLSIARLISSSARSLQELLPSPGTHPPPQRPTDSPDLKGLLKCTWILSQSFVDHSIHQFLDFPSGHKRQEAGEAAPFLFLVISAVITTQWEWEQQQWSPPLKEYLPCTSSHAKGLYMMSLYLHIIKKHYSHFTDEETEALRG